ncbi:MAG: hypothetical protein WCQ21_00680 [Verrucomicrobiota bacterium]
MIQAGLSRANCASQTLRQIHDRHRPAVYYVLGSSDQRNLHGTIRKFQ